jgi:hypothetical protein
MGFENAELMFGIANVLAFGVSCFAAVLFFIGFYFGPEHVEPLRFSDKPKIDDQDLYAIATGDEEYLAAHCTLDSKEELRREREEIQRMKNHIAKLKLQRELEKLNNPAPQAKPKQEDDQLISDCIEALVALGEKKSVARAKVNKFFVDNPNVKTVDQFIAGVFQR